MTEAEMAEKMAREAVDIQDPNDPAPSEPRMPRLIGAIDLSKFIVIERAEYERLLADSERLDDVIELGLRVYHCLDGHWHVLPVGGNKAPDGGLDYWTSGRAALDAARRGKG